VSVLSVCLSVGLSLVKRELWKNGRLDRDTVLGGESDGFKKRCIRWESRSRTEIGKFVGEMGQCNENGEHMVGRASSCHLDDGLKEYAYCALAPSGKFG